MKTGYDEQKRQMFRTAEEIDYTVMKCATGRTLEQAKRYFLMSLRKIDLFEFPDYIGEMSEVAIDADNLQDFRASAKYFSSLVKAHLHYMQDKTK